MLNIPKIIGHRGACGYAPENTIESIHTAADMDVRWVELDVKLTKDDVPIIFHDDILDRTTNGSGAVANKTYDEIRDLDAGSWFSDGFYTSTIPRLEDVIDVLIERDLGVNLEIKPCAGREVETAEIALDLMAQYWDRADNILISSFEIECLQVAHDMIPDWSRGVLFKPDVPQNWAEIAEALDAASVNIHESAANEIFVRQIMKMGKRALVYTVNDPVRAANLRKIGVDAFFTDVPDVLMDALGDVH